MDDIAREFCDGGIDAFAGYGGRSVQVKRRNADARFGIYAVV